MYYNETLNCYNVLQLVSEYQLYCFYLNSNVVIGGVKLSPFRSETNPSFSIFSGKRDGTLLWKDFSTGEFGNIFNLIKKLYNFSYADALSQINKDFNLKLLDFNVKFNRRTSISPDSKYFKKQTEQIRQKKEINYVTRNLENYDEKYWLKYGIKTELLKDYNIYPIQTVFLGDSVRIINTNKEPIYGIIKDNRVKIYRPLSSKIKWLNSLTRDDITSYVLKKEVNNNFTIISKSLKDVICIVEHLKLDAISVLSENTFPSVETIYREFPKKVIIWFDNDKAGIIGSNKLENILKSLENFEVINISKNTLGSKDFSDLIKTEGIESAITKTKQLLESYYDFTGIHSIS